MIGLRDDRGSVSVFLAVVALAFLAAAGLALDGGRKVAALRQASHLADNAARAAAQAVDRDHLRTTGEVRLAPDEARYRAASYLETQGLEGQVSVAGDAAIVTVRLTVSPVLLPLGPTTVTATETAAATTEEPG